MLDVILGWLRMVLNGALIPIDVGQGMEEGIKDKMWQ